VFVSLLPVRKIIFIGVYLFLGSIDVLAQGSPPFNTDDAGTVEKKHWELDLGVSTLRARTGDQTWEVPSIDFGYGLTENIEIDYGVPVQIVRADGESARSGLGNSVAGVKWRFFEDTAAGLAISVNPQVEFNNPTSSRRRGLVEDNTEFILPFQLQKSFGEIETAFNVGRTFHSREPRETDGWSAGVAAGEKLSKHLHAGAELYGETARKFDHGFLLFNVGVIYEIDESICLSMSLGRGVAGEDRPDFVGFIGVQLMR
jgi:hypothetical protein